MFFYCQHLKCPWLGPCCFGTGLNNIVRAANIVHTNCQQHDSALLRLTMWAYVWALQLASSSGNTKYFHLRKGSKEIPGDREMVRWDIKGYIGIPLSFTKKNIV